MVLRTRRDTADKEATNKIAWRLQAVSPMATEKGWILGLIIATQQEVAGVE